MTGGVFVDDRGAEKAPEAQPQPRIELHLPCPPSVNETRRIDLRHKTKHDAWARRADQHVMVQRKNCPKIAGPYKIHITLSDKSRMDLDNVIKATLDYLANIELVQGDSRDFAREILLRRGVAPEGILVRVWSVAEGY